MAAYRLGSNVEMFDGGLRVLSAIECMQTLKAMNYSLNHTIEIRVSLKKEGVCRIGLDEKTMPIHRIAITPDDVKIAAQI